MTTAQPWQSVSILEITDLFIKMALPKYNYIYKWYFYSVSFFVNGVLKQYTDWREINEDFAVPWILLTWKWEGTQLLLDHITCNNVYNFWSTQQLSVDTDAQK